MLASCALLGSNACPPMHGKLSLTLIILVFGGEVCAQDRAGDFQIAKISRDLITAPQFSYTGAEQKREPRDRWLRVDVKFSTAPAFTEELTFKYYVFLAGKVLTGEVTHANVLAGREHHSVMYVPPHALAFVMQNRPANTTSIENIAVQIVQKGELNNELSLSRGRPQWYASLPVVAGLMLNKSESPFAALFSDYYEQIKSTGH